LPTVSQTTEKALARFKDHETLRASDIGNILKHFFPAKEQIPASCSLWNPETLPEHIKILSCAGTEETDGAGFKGIFLKAIKDPALLLGSFLYEGSPRLTKDQLESFQQGKLPLVFVVPAPSGGHWVCVGYTCKPGKKAEENAAVKAFYVDSLRRTDAESISSDFVEFGRLLATMDPTTLPLALKSYFESSSGAKVRGLTQKGEGLEVVAGDWFRVNLVNFTDDKEIFGCLTDEHLTYTVTKFHKRLMADIGKSRKFCSEEEIKNPLLTLISKNMQSLTTKWPLLTQAVFEEQFALEKAQMNERKKAVLAPSLVEQGKALEKEAEEKSLAREDGRAREEKPGGAS
jgi:hypothetical protein